MSIPHTFHMSLQSRTTREWESGDTIYEVIVTTEGYHTLPQRCEGRSIAEAYDEANTYIATLIYRMCNKCGEIMPEGDESMRNAGICLPCYDQVLANL